MPGGMRPRGRGRAVLRGTAVAAMLHLVLTVAPGAWAQKPAPAAVPVGTVAVEQRAVSSGSDFVGRVESIDKVEIRARVTGFLQDVLFKEGSVVKKGDVLYRIEPETFKAAVQQAQGALVEAQAKYANAAAQRARTQELVKTDAAARATLDQRVAAEKMAQGEIVVADANLTTAKVNLSYTEIFAPFTGEVGRTAVTAGNVVGPNSGPLTVMVSRDPMYVTFPVSQREFLRVQSAEQRQAAAQTLAVRIRFSDGTPYKQVGHINFVNVTVDPGTDTVLVRATIPNPDGKLIDGQLVRVAVEAQKPPERLLVPQAALVVDQQGPYVFVVVDGKAEVRRVTLGGESGAYAIVEKGLKAGEQVVVQGMEALRPGNPVIASPVTPPESTG